MVLILCRLEFLQVKNYKFFWPWYILVQVLNSISLYYEITYFKKSLSALLFIFVDICFIVILFCSIHLVVYPTINKCILNLSNCLNTVRFSSFVL
jgi:glucan phosphoethanolaminetransferase (alkaline phosphatase superfamily)